MAARETLYLPSVVLEVDFAGDEATAYDLKTFRSGLKGRLVKKLIDDGVAFEERGMYDEWNGEDAVSRLENVVDAWVLANRYDCSKSKDRHSRKARWVLECEEQVTILMMPGE
jgi:hypothetical protein